jgi:hypothetical protein
VLGFLPALVGLNGELQTTGSDTPPPHYPTPCSLMVLPHVSFGGAQEHSLLQLLETLAG